MVIEEMKKRGYKIKSFDNYHDFFDKHGFLFYQSKPFKSHHTDEYLLICFWNLREKYIRGQKDFDEGTWNKLQEFMGNELSRMLDKEVGERIWEK